MQQSKRSAGFTIAEILIAAGIVALIGLMLAMFLGGQGRVNKDIQQEAQASRIHATLFTQLEADLKHTNPAGSSLGRIGGNSSNTCLILAGTDGNSINYCATAGVIERRHNGSTRVVAPRGQTISVEYAEVGGAAGPSGFLVTLTPPPRGDGTIPASATRRVTPRGGA